MLWRTRFIDEALERAVKNGATQVVILGAGFDTRAYRYRELLRHCRVIEADAAPTQEYKMRRVREALGETPANVTYCAINFANESLIEGLRQAGFVEGEMTFYIWEGVCMYLPEDAVRRTLHMVASHSAPGSSLVLDYANSLGIEFGKLSPSGPGGIFTQWKEPWIFGTPGADGRDFFRELGFDPGVPLSTISPEVVKRYGTRQDGTSYATHVFERLQKEAQARSQVLPSNLVEAQKAIAAAGGSYWFTELIVLDRATDGLEGSLPAPAS
jgi:methyltransferase (TIGR00027 family)